MTVIVPNRPVTLNLSHEVTVTPSAPIVVRAHARRRPVRSATKELDPRIEWPDHIDMVIAARKRRLRRLQASLQRHAWRSIWDPVRERATKRVYDELEVIDGLMAHFHRYPATYPHAAA